MFIILNDIYTVKIITNFDEFQTISDQWDAALMRYQHASIHLSSEYISAIWKADDGALNPHIFIIYNGDIIAGLAAIDKSQYIYRSIAISAALPLDYDRYARADAVILEKPAAPVLYQAIRKIGVDIWHLDRFPKDSIMLKYCADTLPRSQYYAYEDNLLAHINTDVSWDDYLSAKSKNFRRSYKRITQASAALRSEFYTQENGNLEKIISEISKINASSWKNDAGSDFSTDDKRLYFFEHLIGNSLSQNSFAANILYDDNMPVAFTFGVRFQNIFYAIETGYVDSYSDHSAGIMSYINIMQYAFEHPDIIGCDMDIMRANGGYKKRWADVMKIHSSAIVMFGGFGSFVIRLGRIISKIRNILDR